jgi:hypothetical protein
MSQRVSAEVRQAARERAIAAHAARGETGLAFRPCDNCFHAWVNHIDNNDRGASGCAR